MSLFIYNEFLKEQAFLSDERKERLMNTVDSFDMQFKGGAYYFMWPKGVKEELRGFTRDIINDKVPDDEIYTNVKAAFENCK